MLQRISCMNRGPSPMTDFAIYREVMSSALSLEKTWSSPPGTRATFTHQAALSAQGRAWYAPPADDQRGVHGVSQTSRRLRVVPVEKLHQGRGHPYPRHVRGQRPQRSSPRWSPHFTLPGGTGHQGEHPGSSSSTPDAGQCRGWIQRNLPRAELVETSSSARSAELAAQDRKSAALCGELAAEQYGLPILEKDLQDNARQRHTIPGAGTRVWSGHLGHDRTSLMFSIRDEVGAPHRRWRSGGIA